MKHIALGFAAASLLTLVSTNALACNFRQLQDDFRWCLDGRPGKGDIVGGAFVKDAAQLDRGWGACDQSDTADSNFGQCTAGQKIDTARAILGFN